MPDTTYAALLRKCRGLAAGERLHAQIVEHNHSVDRLSGNLLIEIYGKYKRADLAINVFRTMSQRNVFTWNAMIAAHLQNENSREALELFRAMNFEGIKPDRFTCIVIVDVCGNFGCLAQAKFIHAIVTDGGFEADTVVATAIVTMYKRCRSLADARSVFNRIKEKNVVTWTAMISAYAQNGHADEALKLFPMMELEGVKANEVTLVSVVISCASLNALHQGEMFHQRVVAEGYNSDIILGNALVHMYGKLNRLEEARTVFDKMQRKNLVTWNSMIAVYARHGKGESALDIFRRLDLEGFRPNKISYVSMVDACAMAQAVASGKLIHSCMIADEIDADNATGNALLNMYAKCGCPIDARDVFEKIVGKDKISWTAMIAAYAQSGQGKKAVSLFREMDQAGIKPDKLTYVNVLDACVSIVDSCPHEETEVSNTEALAYGQQIHARILSAGLTSDTILDTAVMNMYGKCGRTDMATSTFESMPQKEVATWNAIFAMTVQHEQGMETLPLFRKMDLEGLRPDKVSFLCVIEACACLAAYKHGKMLHSRILSSGLKLDDVLISALIHFYSKCGNLQDAQSVFTEAQCDVVSWSVMIAAYAQFGRGKEALCLFRRLQQGGSSKPDAITFVNVVFACTHTGLIADALQVFCSMESDYGMTPNIEHFGCLVDLLGRVGRLVEAESVIVKMPVTPTSITWMSLLSSCRTHNDVVRADHVTKQFSRLASSRSTGSPLVLLSNVYTDGVTW